MRNKLITSLTLLCGLLSSCGSTSSEISVPDKLDGDVLVARNIEVNKKSNDPLKSLSSSLPVSKENLRRFQRDGQTFRYESAMGINNLWNEGEIKQATFNVYRIDTTIGKEVEVEEDKNIFCLGSSVTDKSLVRQQMDNLYNNFGNLYIRSPLDYNNLLYGQRDTSDPSYDRNEPNEPITQLNLRVCSSIFK